jgi:DNA-binding CsgD family transcriptional regulator
MTAIGLGVVSAKGIWVWARDLAPVAVQALLASGLRTKAHDLAEAFATGLRDRDAPAARAASAFCRAMVLSAEDRHYAAVRMLGRAERLWRELPCTYEAAQVREARARCLLDQRDKRGANLLRDAMDTFDSLGASWDARRVRAELRAHAPAVRTASHRGRKASGNGLSPRETEVARLAGMGKKNREIAEALFLSQRTVEAHVASALRKLGAQSREALASLDRGEERDGEAWPRPRRSISGFSP